MQVQQLEQNYHGAVQVDLCFACGGLWFDRLGSVQLSPAAVMILFKEIQAHLKDARQPMARELDCPRCGEGLALGFDLSKAGKFSYFRCRKGDGRFTPFFQFLREKQFVRSLTAAEVERVRSQVRQIRCSECGAPIDLDQSTECPHCRAPVSFLDPEAVERAVRMWSEAENRRHGAPTPEALGDALGRMQLPKASWAQSPPGHADGHLLSGTGAHMGIDAVALDLVAIGVQAIGRLFAHND